MEVIRQASPSVNLGVWLLWGWAEIPSSPGLLVTSSF